MPTLTAPKSDLRLFSAGVGEIDAQKGVFKNVSIMTEGEALGHGVWCDLGTLQSVFALSQSKPIKAYMTHGDFFTADRLGKEIGLFSGLYIDSQEGQPAKLRARQFTFFKAFRDANPQEYETLLQLAEASPNLFGVSLSFSGRLVWTFADGTEQKWTQDGEMPDGAVRDMPSVRVTRVFSADFVSDPATNVGLFSQPVATATISASTVALQAVQIDAPAHKETSKAPFTMLKQLKEKFGSDSQKFARACELLSENENLTISDIEAKLDTEAKAARFSKMEADFAAQAKQIAELQEQLKDKDAEIEAAKKGAAPVNLGAPAETKDVLAQFEALEGAEATAFYRANRTAIAEAIEIRRQKAKRNS